MRAWPDSTARTTSSSRARAASTSTRWTRSKRGFDTFWRSGDNFRHEANSFRWAVSQAAPLRRIHAARDLELFDPTARVNYASGGYLGNSIVEGNLVLGSQQQWIS